MFLRFWSCFWFLYVIPQMVLCSVLRGCCSMFYCHYFCTLKFCVLFFSAVKFILSVMNYIPFQRIVILVSSFREAVSNFRFTFLILMTFFIGAYTLPLNDAMSYMCQRVQIQSVKFSLEGYCSVTSHQ